MHHTVTGCRDCARFLILKGLQSAEPYTGKCCEGGKSRRKLLGEIYVF